MYIYVTMTLRLMTAAAIISVKAGSIFAYR